MSQLSRYSILQAVGIEVDQQSLLKSGKAQVGLDLCTVNRKHGLDALDFDQHRVFHTKSATKARVIKVPSYFNGRVT